MSLSLLKSFSSYSFVKIGFKKFLVVEAKWFILCFPQSIKLYFAWWCVWNFSAFSSLALRRGHLLEIEGLTSGCQDIPYDLFSSWQKMERIQRAEGLLVQLHYCGTPRPQITSSPYTCRTFLQVNGRAKYNEK